MLAYESVTSGRVSIETFRTKQLYLNDIQARMWEELVLFDTFVKETDRAFSTLLTQITVKREAVLGDLQTNKAKLRTYLNAIQQTIQSKRYLESFEAVTVLDEYILSGYRSFHAPETKIFTGKMAFQEIFGLLEKCVSYEMQDSLILQESGHIPVLKGNHLRLFNRKTLHMSQLTLSHVTRIDYATAYCFLTPNTLLAVGGIGHSDVYEVNIRSGTVERTANMNCTRWWTGVFPYRGQFVYAFGGSNGNFLNSAEKYTIETKLWTNVRSTMQRAKQCCSVCEHLSGLYMSGIEQKGSSMECFYPIDETFRLIRSDSYPIASIMCCIGDELYTIRHNKVEFANLARGPAVTLMVKATFQPINTGQYWLCCPIKVQAGELVSVLNPCGEPFGLFRLSPRQGLFTQVANFLY